MTHRLLTVTVPFAAEHADAVDALLAAMGNPPAPALRARLDATGIVHFMSITAMRGTAPGQAHLVLEASADAGGPDPAEAIAAALDRELQRLFAAAHVVLRPSSLPTFLRRHDLALGGSWRRTAGLGFNGSPGLSVARIRAEAALAESIGAEMADVLAGPAPAREKLARVRSWLWDRGEKWAFTAEATPFLFGGRERTPAILAGLLAIVVAQLFWPLALVAVGLIIWLGLPLGGLASVALLAAAVALACVHLRRLEAANTPDDTAPGAARLGKVLRYENRGAQNLLAACSTMQGGWFRRLTLRFAFAFAAQGVARVFRPGHLRRIGVIHFARWVLVPGTDKLLFFSNFSDTWESYLEDFISKAADGLTAVWGNTLGFPRTRLLFGAGAADGDRFRRWARRQQVPVLFWYRAYPELRIGRIRLNAAIRRGVAAAATDVEAEDWLACFGSAPRPAFELDKAEMQTLLFGGVSRLRFSASLVLRFGTSPADAAAWLRAEEGRFTFGEHVPGDHPAGHRAATVAFSASGLTRLGVAAADLATFSDAFQQGMAAPWRARALGDEGPQAPDAWLWGQDGADAFVTLFARDADALAHDVAALRRSAGAHGHSVVFEQVMAPLPEHGQVTEPFGFADGVSQPVLRDTPRARLARNTSHVLDAGEFVLGYPDGRGYLPPTPTVSAGRDGGRLLPDLVDDLRSTREPFTPGGSGMRDFGRNGSYLVVRHLEQDVAGFHGWAAGQAARLEAAGQNVWGLPPDALKELLLAKVVGRWKDGRSLVRHAHPPDSDMAQRQAAPPDNDFLFSREDRQGLRCPFGAHLRRANPRDDLDEDGPPQLAIANRHRLMRVGRHYPPAENGKPGLLFTCLNADIERQFEFVQQTWLLGTNYHQLPSEADPLLGAGPRTFTVPTRQGPLRLKGLADFVRVRGGGYFFLPSRSALRYLAHGEAASRCSLVG